MAQNLPLTFNLNLPHLKLSRLLADLAANARSFHNMAPLY